MTRPADADESPWARAAARARAGAVEASAATPTTTEAPEAIEATAAAAATATADTAAPLEVAGAAGLAEASQAANAAELAAVVASPDAIEPPPAARAAPVRKPTWSFMFAHPAHVIGLGFGSGLSPSAPGTMGTLLAWLLFRLLQPHLTDPAWAALIVVSFGVGWWACTVTARHMGVADPGAIVWDEILAFWIVLWLIGPGTLGAEAVAFVLFRVFDAAKPGPVAWADALFKGRRGKPIGWAQGFGIIFDDLVAALCTLLVIAIWRLW